MNNQTTFQTAINEAQPTLAEKAKVLATTAATTAVVFTVSNIETGYETTVGCVAAFFGWWDKVVRDVYNMTH